MTHPTRHAHHTVSWSVRTETGRRAPAWQVLLERIVASHGRHHRILRIWRMRIGAGHRWTRPLRAKALWTTTKTSSLSTTSKALSATSKALSATAKALSTTTTTTKALSTTTTTT